MITDRSMFSNYFIRISLIIVTFLININSYSQRWPAGAHDPSSIIKDGDKYWVFSTGDGIYAKYSTDLVTWTDGPSPFQNGQFPDWILNYAKNDDGAFEGFFWAPDIIYMNNQYYLYYSCSVWGSMNSCIGCVVNKTLDPASPDYKWIDQGDIKVFSPDWSVANTGWTVNAIDAALMRGPDGKIWMAYGSFNENGIMITEIDSVSGKPFGTRTSIANSWTGTWYGEGEGACIFYRKGYYYVVYNKGGCCNGIASSYYMVIGRSKNPRGPYVDKEGKPMRVKGAKSGGTILFKHDHNRGLEDRYYGPGHLGIYRENGVDYLSFHYYDPNGYYPSSEANYKGGPTQGLALLKWDEDGWPVLSMDFIEEGVYSIINGNSNKAIDIKKNPFDNTTILYQTTEDNTKHTQKWLFNSLGTGEYTIQQYANLDNYVEASGVDNSQYLISTSNYTGEINQKFRVVKDINDNVIIYPSTKDKVFEIPNSYTADYQVMLNSKSNKASQNWLFEPFDAAFSVEYDAINLAFIDTVSTNITISGNVLWYTEVLDESWLKVLPESGEGDTVPTLHLTPNYSEKSRTNVLKVHSHTGAFYTIFIKQEGAPKVNLSVNKSHIDLAFNDTVNNEISVASDGLWSVTIEDDSWLKVEQGLVDGDAQLTLRTSVNTTSLERMNKIYIQPHSGDADTITIVQARSPEVGVQATLSDLDKLKVYPNPSDGQVYLNIGDDANIEVYSSTGARIQAFRLNDSNRSMDISYLESGAYIFVIEVNNIRVQRMVIKK